MYIRRGGRYGTAFAFIPVLNDACFHNLLDDGRSVSEFAQSVGCELDIDFTPCLVVVDAIADLINAGKWHWLVGLCRWHALAQSVPCLHHCAAQHEARSGSMPDHQLTPQAFLLSAVC